MADVVQYRLERMVNELDDLERRALFTRQEIAEIVKQRRKFEYRLKRPSPLKQDFLAYIDYETQLDSLRHLRKRKAMRESSKKMKKSISDFAGTARIVQIYKMAVTRYKGDVDLWFLYLEFCRQRKNGRMKKALAQVIRFHPKVPGVWIYAAAWEFDQNLNVAAARALMQNGLRMCPKSKDLWVEYLRMELTYLNKLKARRVALGEDKGTLVLTSKDKDDKQWQDENKDLFMSLNEGRDGESEAQDAESEKKSDLFREQGSVVLQAIYGSALEALPSSLSLRKKFFEILLGVDLADSEEMKKKILDDMSRDFSADPEYWDWLARLEIPDLDSVEDLSEVNMHDKLQKSIEVYEEALGPAPSAQLFNYYINFLMEIIFREGRGNPISELSARTEKYISQLLTVYTRAETMGFLTEDLASKYVSLYLQLERVDEARELAQKLCSGKKLSRSVPLWQLRLSTEVKYSTRNKPSPDKTDLRNIFELFKNVLVEVPVSKAESLWLMALEFLASHKHYFDKLSKVAFISLAKSAGHGSGFCLASTLVKHVLQKDGIACAREMYNKFLGLPRPSLEIFRTSIELEVGFASSGKKESLDRVRKLFEAALSTHDQDLSLWQDYHSMEIKMGTSETANAVYWRARKTLKDASALSALTSS